MGEAHGRRLTAPVAAGGGHQYLSAGDSSFDELGRGETVPAQLRPTSEQTAKLESADVLSTQLERSEPRAGERRWLNARQGNAAQTPIGDWGAGTGAISGRREIRAGWGEGEWGADPGEMQREVEESVTRRRSVAGRSSSSIFCSITARPVA